MAQKLFQSMKFSTASLFIVLSILTVITACQGNEETAVPLATETKIAGTPIQALLETQAPQVTETPAIAEATIVSEPAEPSVSMTAAPPSPTSPPEPTATATPLPEPTFYTVQPGDTLIGIAEQFSISLDSLVFANGFTSAGEFPLSVGDELQIPFCTAHRILPGNTLAGIAQLCDVTLDELVAANLQRLAALGSLASVPIGFVIYIPQEAETVEEVDCSPQPAREQVIEYQPGSGEGLFCLAQKFGVSTTAIIQGNIQKLATGATIGEESLLIPPVDGAVYIVTSEDVIAETNLADLAEWYDVEVDAIGDWNGNLVSDPLVEGQQLFVVGANLVFGPFNSQPTQEEAESEAGS